MIKIYRISLLLLINEGKHQHAKNLKQFLHIICVTYVLVSIHVFVSLLEHMHICVRVCMSVSRVDAECLT